MTNFIFIVVICFQINTLYYFFWASAFANTFTATSAFTSGSLITGVEASLTVVITVFYFISRLTHIQIFIICMFEVFAYALNWAICRWGINALTGGGGMTVWLFGLIYVCLVKKIRFPDLKDQESSKYFTKTIQLIGIMVIIISWPSFNSLTTVHDTSVTNIDANALLSQ